MWNGDGRVVDRPRPGSASATHDVLERGVHGWLLAVHDLIVA
jgi:hypothetical protein